MNYEQGRQRELCYGTMLASFICLRDKIVGYLDIHKKQILSVLHKPNLDHSPFTVWSSYLFGGRKSGLDSYIFKYISNFFFLYFTVQESLLKEGVFLTQEPILSTFKIVKLVKDSDQLHFRTAELQLVNQQAFSFCFEIKSHSKKLRMHNLSKKCQ